MSIASLNAVTTASPVVSEADLQGTFQKAVAGLFFGELMKSLRSTVGEPAYIHGGQAEKMFEAQLDQVLVESLAETSGGGLVDDLYRQFRVQLGLPAENSAKTTQLPGLSSAASSLEPLESVREARSATDRMAVTTPTSALTGLFRK
jgi:Rod binding domain-containing protein